MNNAFQTPTEKRQALEAILLQHPGNTCTEQCQRLRVALSQFSVTTFELMRHLDLYDPRARVMQLRMAGDRIDTVWDVIVSEAGTKHRVGRYVLRPQAAEVSYGTH